MPTGAGQCHFSLQGGVLHPVEDLQRRLCPKLYNPYSCRGMNSGVLELITFLFQKAADMAP